MTDTVTDRQKQFSGTRPVAEGYELDEGALGEYMRAHVDGFDGLYSVEQFRGGQSNPTYKITARSGAYVLRRKPPGKLLPSAHAVDREFRVISALYKLDFPVARPYALCEDAGVLGTMFYIMDCVEGRVIWEPQVPDADPQGRAAIYDAMNETFARLHMIDYEAAGLRDFGKPTGYVSRQIKRWSEQYRLSETRKIPEMDRLMDWLPGACPESARTSLVHGDYRLDNMILHPREAKVLAVLDWELATLGDPIGDFTYHMMQWRMPPNKGGAGTASLVGFDLESLGIPSMEQYVAAYCARVGIERIDNLDFYFAYNFFRLAGIVQGIVGRVRDGTASSPFAAEMESRVGPLAEVAWQYAERAGAR